MISPSAVLPLLLCATYMELLSPTPLSIDHVEDKGEEKGEGDGTESGTGGRGNDDADPGRGMASDSNSFPFKAGYSCLILRRNQLICIIKHSQIVNLKTFCFSGVSDS